MKKIILLIILLIPALVGCEEIIFNTLNNTSESNKNIINNDGNLETVTIDRVIDGDTVDVITEDQIIERVRLLLIDTPESVHPEKEPQPFGIEASNYMKKHLKEGNTVQLEKGTPAKDNYDRLLAYIWVDGENLNKVMIEEGYARVAFVYEPNTKYLKEFEKSQEQAKKNQKNIWSIEGYVESEFVNY